MAIGQVKSQISQVTSGNYLDIRPPEGEEWVIHNIYYSGAVELYFTDGTNYIKFDTGGGSGGHLNFNFHITYNYWIAVKNITDTNILIGFDGIQTK
jgi:hypothetical protein